MHKAEWYLVRRGQLQLFGSQRQATGDPFLFLPLFRTHREADYYCRESGLWHQGIRPMHSHLSEGHRATDGNRSVSPFSQAAIDGVRVIGVFVGFGSDGQSCWEYFRASVVSLNGAEISAHFEALPEDERPLL